MKIRPIVIAMVAWLVLPLAGANARAVFDPGLIHVGAGADLQRGVGQIAEKFNRDKEDCDGDKDDKSKNCHRCKDGDKDDKGGDKNDKDCEKSKSKH